MHTASQALAIERQASAQPSLAERVSRPKTRAILGLMRLNFLSVRAILGLMRLNFLSVHHSYTIFWSKHKHDRHHESPRAHPEHLDGPA